MNKNGAWVEQRRRIPKQVQNGKFLCTGQYCPRDALQKKKLPRNKANRTEKNGQRSIPNSMGVNPQSEKVAGLWAKSRQHRQAK